MPQNLDFNAYFSSRADATSLLIEILPTTRIVEDQWLIVAISPQAVPSANMIACRFGLNYDLLITESIYAPNNSECTVAMVSETEEIVIHEALVNSFEINLDYIYGQAHRVYEEKIIPQAYRYRKGDLISSLKGRNVLFVDIGCEVGLKEICCVKTAMKLEAASIMYATPVIATDVASSLEIIVDELFIVKRIDNFVNTEFYYENLSELSQDDIIEILKNSEGYLPFQKDRRNLDGIQD